jgi:hypothetical protein
VIKNHHDGGCKTQEIEIAESVLLRCCIGQGWLS